MALSWKETEAIDEAFIKRKIELAVNQRLHFFYNEDTTAFRVFNGEGDGFGGFTIDHFNGYYLIQWYSLELTHSVMKSTVPLETSRDGKGLMRRNALPRTAVCGR